MTIRFTNLCFIHSNKLQFANDLTWVSADVSRIEKRPAKTSLDYRKQDPLPKMKCTSIVFLASNRTKSAGELQFAFEADEQIGQYR